jgi:hypothetical protein
MITKEKPSIVLKKKFSKWQSEKITSAMRNKIFSLVRNQ